MARSGGHGLILATTALSGGSYMLDRVEKRPTASRCGARPNDDWAATRASLRSLNPRRISTRSDTILRDSA